MLARLKYIKNAANTPETKQSLRERLRLTKNEKSQRVAMKRIRAGNDRLFILMGPPMELEYYRSRKPGGIDILTKRPGTARGRKVLEPSYRRLAKKWPKGCCSQFQHEARLSLSSCCNPHRNPDDGINMVVSLPGENDDQPNWQKLSMTALQERTVHFADGGEAQQSSANSHKRDVDSESLCSLLHQALDNGADLRIGLEKEKLWQLGSELATWKIREQSGTPLKDFLPGSPQSWRLRERSILAVILSHAVLHCLESPWLCNNWSKEHVVFFRKESSTEFEFDQPFLKVEFQEEDSEPVPFDPVSIHGNPIILALGILLLEIYTQTALESRREGQHSSDRESNANTNLTTAITFLKELDGDLRLKYRQAVKECLYWNDVQLDGDSLRQRIYDRIVEPLERELVEGFPDAENLFHICGQYSKEE
ncbi:hypothetical protein BKA66DRAFT_25811 [Pyrenochaeta sp. MPI-SDFR-AT-0127]|nr:hypothetical protein BKA66DRAFT_25811 [Pyrenochaeta sp. MPI-SDFR-AT-0127]